MKLVESLSDGPYNADQTVVAVLRPRSASGTMMKHACVILAMTFAAVAVMSHLAPAEEQYIFDEGTGQWLTPEQVEQPAEGALGDAQELIKAGKVRKAEKRLKKYIKNNPDAPDRAQAMLLYADCAFLRNRYYSAHQRYEKVIAEYPQTREFALALRHQFGIAQAWLEGKKRRLWHIFRVGATSEAEDVLSQVEELGAGHRIAEVAVWTKANHYYRSGEYELAEMTFRRLVKEYESKRYEKPAMFYSASSALACFPGVPFDDTALIESRELFEEYRKRFPQDAEREDVSTLLKDIENKRAEKEFKVGEFYVRIRKPSAAAFYFRYVIKTWPESLWADRARAKLERLGFEVDVAENE